jgi:uncharacterized protein YndB with AHSA1/START domain
MPDYSNSIDIDAPPEVVFAHLVSAERMVRWMGEHAELRPEPGGMFAVDIKGHLVRGRYLEVEPPRRVVVSWGMAGSHDLPPGASRVEFVLTPTATGTRVRLDHRDLPAPRADGHRIGWAHFLPRLATAAGGGEPGPDGWIPPGRPRPGADPTQGETRHGR